MAVEAIAEGAAGESLLVLGVGFGDVVWSRGMEPDGAVALHAANGYVCTLPGLLDRSDFPVRDSFARGIGCPRSHFALIDFLQAICLPPVKLEAKSGVQNRGLSTERDRQHGGRKPRLRDRAEFAE